MDYVYDLLQSKGGTAPLRQIMEEARGEGHDILSIANAIWQWDEAGIIKHGGELICFTSDHEQLIEYG